MKLVKAYIRTYMADRVIHALRKIDAPRLTAIDIRGMGDEIDPRHLEVSAQHAGTYTTMVKLELVCKNEEAQAIAYLIRENAKTGYRGDGIIVISPVQKVISIRTGEED